MQVQQVKEELRTLRAEQHIKQLSKELRMARAALEQERKLRTIQSDTIKVSFLCLESQLYSILAMLCRFYGRKSRNCSKLRMNWTVDIKMNDISVTVCTCRDSTPTCRGSLIICREVLVTVIDHSCPETSEQQKGNFPD